MKNNFNLHSYLRNNLLLKESTSRFLNENVFKTGDKVIIKKDAQWTDDVNKISGMDEDIFNALKNKPSYVTSISSDNQEVYIAQEKGADVDTFVAPEYLEKVS